MADIRSETHYPLHRHSGEKAATAERIAGM
jgi:hypothetical protein